MLSETGIKLQSLASELQMLGDYVSAMEHFCADIRNFCEDLLGDEHVLELVDRSTLEQLMTEAQTYRSWRTGGGR